MPNLLVLHERHQHAVGHGFFHTASVRLNDARHAFEYVYDVGAKKTTELLTPCLEEYASVLATRPVDLLVLSHLHDDHVSGLDRLLLRCKVHTVALPYVDPIEKLILVGARIAAGNADATSIALTVEPANWLRARGVQRVLEMQPRPPLAQGDAQGVDDANPEVLPPPPAAHWRLTKGPPTVLGADPAEPVGDESISHDTPLVLGLGRTKVWEFKFFCFRADAQSAPLTEKILAIFNVSAAELGARVTSEWVLSQLRSNPAAREKLAQAYRDLVGARRLNWTSLCLWSAPALDEDEYRWSSHAFIHGDGKRRAGLDNDAGDRVAWLGVGDAELADPEVGAAFSKHFEPDLAKYRLATMSLPHHGSKHNHNQALLSAFDPALVYATCPAPKEDVRRQKHPAVEVEHQIQKWRGQAVIKVDEAEANGLHEWVRVYGYPAPG